MKIVIIICVTVMQGAISLACFIIKPKICYEWKCNCQQNLALMHRGLQSDVTKTILAVCLKSIPQI